MSLLNYANTFFTFWTILVYVKRDVTNTGSIIKRIKFNRLDSSGRHKRFRKDEQLAPTILDAERVEVSSSHGSPG